MKSCLTTEKGTRGFVACTPGFSPTLGGQLSLPGKNPAAARPGELQFTAGHLPGCAASQGQGAGIRRNPFLPVGCLLTRNPSGAGDLLAQRGLSALPPGYPDGWKVEVRGEGGIFQPGEGSESSSGAPSPSRGEVRRIKVTDGPAMIGKRHMWSCLHGREKGGGGDWALTSQTREKHRWLRNQTRFMLNPAGGQ